MAVFSSPHRQTLRLALPLILSNLTVPLTGLVDTAVIGHLDQPHYLAATAMGSLIVTLLMWAFGFLRMSTTGITAQAFGAQDWDQVRYHLVNSLLLALLCASLILLVQEFLWWLALRWVDASEAVKHFGQIYYRIRVWGLPAILIRYVLVGWCLGLHNAKTPLLILMITNGLNMALDVLLVLGLGWGVAGAAWASVMADYIGLVIGLVALRRPLQQVLNATKTRFTLAQTGLIKRLKTNRDILIRTLALGSVFYLQTAIGASLGDVVLAANAVLMNLVMVLSYGLDGFAHAVEALSGKALGERNGEQLKQMIRVTGIWSVATAAVFSLVYFTLGEPIIGLITDLEIVRHTATEYLPYLTLIPLIAVWSYWLDGIFIGITEFKAMRNSMLVAVIVVFIPLSFLVKWVGNHGLWIAFIGFMVIRALSLAWLLRGWFRRNQTILGSDATT